MAEISDVVDGVEAAITVVSEEEVLVVADHPEAVASVVLVAAVLAAVAQVENGDAFISPNNHSLISLD